LAQNLKKKNVLSAKRLPAEQHCRHCRSYEYKLKIEFFLREQDAGGAAPPVFSSLENLVYYPNI
jgi:hypothetical protein